MDDLILYSYLCFTALVVFVNWVVKRYREAKMEANNLLVGLDLSDYTFIYNSGEKPCASEVKKINLFQKFTVFFFAAVISVTPLYEFIATLGPRPVDYFMCCICF